MRDVTTDRDLVAFCGLYCGACGAYRKGRCPGCRENDKAKWCKIRTCCAERSYLTCAACEEHVDPNECRTFNNFVAKVMGVLLNSNRQACVLKIRELGTDGFASYMAERGRQTLPRRGAGRA